MNTLRAMFSNKSDKVLLVWFLLLTGSIISLNLFHWSYNGYGLIFVFFQAGLPCIGTMIGFYRMKQWGGYKSIVGKSLFFISVGLLFWSLGTFIWVYYNMFLYVEVPYPSWMDLAYFQVPIFLGIGIIMLANLTSIQTQVRKTKEKIYFFLIPILMAIVTYYFIFMQLHGGAIALSDGAIKIFLDLYYPGGDIAILTILIIFSGLEFNYIGERLKLPVTLVIIGLVVNYVADFCFSYSTSVGTYYNGNFVDLLFGIAMFTLSLSVSNLHPKL
ncbi:MAG: hypothetical protein WCV88_01110, partial [Patescibacteria group bacterium]